MSMELMVKAMKIRVGNPLRKLVLIKLADNASDQGECWPSYQHIADQCEISKRSVMNHIAALCESGLVKKVTRKGEKGNSSNIYLLHLDGAGDSLGGSANNSLSGAANSPGSAGVAPGGSAGDSPRTSHSFEPVKEPVNEPIAVGASVDESVRVRSNRPEYSPEFEQAWLVYPKRAGGNSKSAAFKAWKARLNEGVNPETMLEGVKRYAGWVSAMGNSGTQFVKQAVTFFGPDLFTDGDNAKCAAYYTAEDNALAHDWSERLAELKGAAFGNPPYSRASQHEGQYITGMRYIMKHASAMRDKGGRYVFLIKAATSEVWWPEDADHIAFIRGRIGFELPAWFIPKDEKQVPTGAFFAGAIAVFDKTWKGPAISYIGRDELEACGEAFLAQVRQQAEKLVREMAA